MGLRDKYSFEVITRTHCTGCGSVFSIRQTIGPGQYGPHEASDLIEYSMKVLLEAKCVNCHSGLKPLEWFEEVKEKKLKKVR
jgi:hypothetical protein